MNFSGKVAAAGGLLSSLVPTALGLSTPSDYLQFIDLTGATIGGRQILNGTGLNTPKPIFSTSDLGRRKQSSEFGLAGNNWTIEPSGLSSADGFKDLSSITSEEVGKILVSIDTIRALVSLDKDVESKFNSTSVTIVPFDDLGLLEKKLGAELFSSLDIKSDSISFRASTYNSQKPKFYIFVPKDNLLNGTAWLPIIYFFSLAREAGALETLNSETFEAVRQKASIVGKEHCNSVISGLQKLLDSSQNLPLPGRTDKLIINPELINNLKLILETL